MIHFTVTKKTNNNDPENVEMTMPLFMEEDIMAPFKEHFLINILKGSREMVNEENVKFCFKMDAEHAEMLKQSLLLAYTKHSGFNTCN